MEHRSYTDEDKRAAVMAYLVTGSIKEAINASNSTRFTVARWMKENWWKQMTAALHSEYAARIDAQFTGIISSSLAEIIDRLENGDASTRWNEERGEFERRIVSGRDMAIIMGICYDKRALLRAQEPSTKHSVSAIAEKLAAIGAASIGCDKT